MVESAVGIRGETSSWKEESDLNSKGERLLQLEEAAAALRNAVEVKEKIVKLPILKARGRVLADDIIAPIAVPSFPKSAMDGYAVRSAEIREASLDNPVKLKVIGELCAGEHHLATSPLGGDAVRVMTGSLIPGAYDAVVKQEDTDYGEESVTIYAPVKPYQNYSRVGEDISQGELVMKKYTRVTSLQIGLLASLGIAAIRVLEPPRVAIITTGTELEEPGIPLEEAHIYNSLNYLLSSRIDACGFTVISAGNCDDDIEALERAVAGLIEASDVIITTGGVSVGKKDLIPELIDRLNAACLFQGVNIRPGLHTRAALYGGKVLLCLSGNPYAAYAHFELLFRPLAAKLMNNDIFEPKKTFAKLKNSYPKRNQIRCLVRAHFENGEVTLPVQAHYSSVISNLVSCNCFIDMEAGKEYMEGESVTVWQIGEG